MCADRLAIKKKLIQIMGDEYNWEVDFEEAGILLKAIQKFNQTHPPIHLL